MVIEVGAEDVIYNTVTSKQAYAWCEVVRTNCSLNHDRNVRAIDDTCVIEFASLETKKSVFDALSRTITYVAVDCRILYFGTSIAIYRETTTNGTYFSNTCWLCSNITLNWHPLEFWEHLKDSAYTRCSNNEVSSATTVTCSDSVCFNDKFLVEVSISLNEPATISRSRRPERNTRTHATIDSSLNHSDDHFTVDFSLDLIRHSVCDLSIDIDTVHVLKVLFKFNRPACAETTCASFNC